MPSPINEAAVLEAVRTHGATKSYPEIAAMVNLPVSVVGALARKAGLKKPYVTVRHRVRQIRALEVVSAHAQTHTLEEMGQMLGLTRERVRQLCVKWQIKRNPLCCSKTLRLLTDSELRQRVRDRDKSISKIADELGVGVEALRNELNRRGIKPRTKREIAAWLLKRGKLKCSRCQRIKKVDGFYPSVRYGYASECRECRAADAKIRWEKNKDLRRKLPTATWDGMFEVFRLFHRTHGHCNVPISRNPRSLSRWLGRQRLDYRAGKLLPERKELLGSLGFDPSELTQKEQERRAALDARWEAWVRQFADFKALHNGRRLPRRDGLEAQLGMWWHSQTSLVKRGLLKPERLQRLIDLGLIKPRNAQIFDPAKPTQPAK